MYAQMGGGGGGGGLAKSLHLLCGGVVRKCYI